MGEQLRSFSDDLARTVEATGGGLVRVEARRRFPASGIVWSTSGLIVTANHVVEREDDIIIGLSDGNETHAELVGRDPSTDLALLRVKASGLSPLQQSPLDNLKVGHLVIALGRPGRKVMASLGMVQILAEKWRTPAGGSVDRYIRTGVEMLPGFSGGALIDSVGGLIGLNSSALARESSLTIPTETIDRVVKQLEAHGHVSRAYLGVGAQPVRIPESMGKNLGQETGLLVVSVEPGSPAEAANLLLGDTIVRLDIDPVRFMDDLIAALSSERIGKNIPIQVIRGGQAIELNVTLGER